MYMCKFRNQGPNVVSLRHITLALFCLVDTGGSSISGMVRSGVLLPPKLYIAFS